MAVKLSDHFTYNKIFKAVIAPILMMIFTSIYGVVDGIFVSNFAENGAFAVALGGGIAIGANSILRKISIKMNK